uniref:acyltransferase family protein n=1 Tax=Microbulbifer agarilyticus TaxID=260552 RepID=UPI000255A4BF|nr:acyltransferase family protein [Microbulbifer agarilyticus]
MLAKLDSTEVVHPAGRKFRAEVEGLRALAVLSVVLFHLDLTWIEGGYVGVDIFFVISGFLITRNIYDALVSKTFSFRDFYIRRIRRLFPALLATITVSAIVGTMLLSPEHLARFSKEIIAAVFSLSNVLFWSEAGYFDLDESFKPLLHTWSLSVEEQFYLFWPAFLVFLFTRGSRSILFIGLIAVALLSIWSAQYMVSHSNASAAFFLLPFRVAEFVIGAMLVFVKPTNWMQVRGVRSIMTTLGIAMMGYAIFTYHAATRFPGYTVLIPCLGAALVIFAGTNPVSRHLLENKVAQFLGRTSYSIYLVHWPLIVFWGYSAPGQLSSTGGIVLILVAIMLLGALLWKFVEQKFRHVDASSKRVNHAPLFFVSCTSICAILVVGAYWTKGSMWSESVVLSAEQVKEGKKRRFNLTRQSCRVRNFSGSEKCILNASRQTLLLGNSHEPDGYNIWHAAYSAEDQNIITFGTVNRCGPFMKDINSDQPDKRNCRERINGLRDEEFVKSLDLVVYSANMPFGRNKAEIWEELVAIKRVNPAVEVVILGGYFNLEKDCSFFIGRSGTMDSCLEPSSISYTREDEYRELAKWRGSREAELLNPRYIDKFALMCGGEVCESSAGAVPFTYDRHHLSLEFSLELGERLKSRYRSVDQLLADAPLLTQFEPES